MADIKKFEGALDQMINLMMEMKNSLKEDQPEEEQEVQVNHKTEDFGDFESIRKALESDKWPEAVNPNLICDPNSIEDKKERGRGIIELMIEEEIEGLKILDFGCGEGHCTNISTEYNPSMSVGYDIKHHDNWGEFENKDNMIITTNWDDVKSNGPYDVIIMFDVIDHLKKQTAVEVLNQVKDVLSDSGKIYLRCHPFTSRHATHLYHSMNKAYMHLVFTESELKQIVPDSEFEEENSGVIYPLATYSRFIEAVGLKTLNRRDITEKVEPFFKIPKIANRIIKNTEFSEFPEFQMTMQFLDYVLSK